MCRKTSSSSDFLISVQVKLRRRTKGEVWEVVSPQDTDETLSVFTSHKRVDKYDDELKYKQTCSPHSLLFE